MKSERRFSSERKETVGGNMVRAFRRWNSKRSSASSRRKNKMSTTESSSSDAFEPWSPENTDSSISSTTESLHRRLSIDVDDPQELTINTTEESPFSASRFHTPRSETSPTNNENDPHRQSPLSTSQQRDSLISMVIYPKNPQPSLPDSLNLWMTSVHNLVQSPEMRALAESSRDVVLSTCGTAKHIACLPITIPLHLMVSSTEMIFGLTGNVLQAIMMGPHHQQQRRAITNNSEIPNPETMYDIQEEEEKKNEILENVVNFFPFLVDTAVKSVAPVLGQQEKPREKSMDEPQKKQDNFLDRLRLDFVPTKSSDPSDDHKSDQVHSTPGVVEVEAPSFYSSRKPTPSDISKNLLRVDDIQVLLNQKKDSSRVMYIDLGSEFSSEQLTNQALHQLVHRASEFVASNPHARFYYGNSLVSPPNFRVDWKPEGGTAKFLRKSASLKWSEQEYNRRLESDILVWSGTMHLSGGGGKHRRKTHGFDAPLFLARGIVVDRSPLDLVHLMWDSERTEEYNKHSLGRYDTVVISDDILHGGSSGTKVVKSETKVPFTGYSVTMAVLMHCCALENEEGYMIVSRSLDSGMAGYHGSDTSMVEKANTNEIIMGINMFRPVPGEPDKTELLSLSQVQTSLVPHFLAKRIGMMGVEDFFKNVRNNPDGAASTLTDSSSDSLSTPEFLKLQTI